MHEYSVASALLDLVDAHVRRERAARVLRVVVQVGELAGVEPVLLREAFALVRAGGPCADAELEIRSVAVRWECEKCAAAIAPALGLGCAACGGTGRLAAGGELLLERIEMEVE